uniref:Uncharacterized protein n=1 Tax=Trypanosoma congolense (strain IL3000) TaxID=1068625 RepID=G0URN8_TRYCI|nr:hypothetical protein, unlikely [Trypanosoma congolense IL3000]
MYIYIYISFKFLFFTSYSLCLCCVFPLFATTLILFTFCPDLSRPSSHLLPLPRAFLSECRLLFLRYLFGSLLSDNRQEGGGVKELRINGERWQGCELKKVGRSDNSGRGDILVDMRAG